MRTKSIMMICFGIAFVFLIIAAGTVTAETNIDVSDSGGGGVGIYSGTDLHDIVGLDNSDFIEMNASNFAGFLLGESLRIYGGDFVSDRTIYEGGLVYETWIEQVEYESDAWDGETYPRIALFRDIYVPTNAYDAGELAILLVDSGENHTLGIGETLDLGNGYGLTLLQINVDGDKAWMEFSKDGSFIDDEMVNISTGPATWILDLDVAGESDVEVFRVNVVDISQTESSILINGLWLIDFQNPYEINASDEFGILEVDSVSNSLSLVNYDSISLIPASIQNIAGGMKFKVTNSIDHLEFYLAITDYMKGDPDGDEDIDFDDFVEFAASYNSSKGDANYEVIFDFDDDNDVDFDDFVWFAGVYQI